MRFDSMNGLYLLTLMMITNHLMHHGLTNS
jgi:hypothetical protein